MDETEGKVLFPDREWFALWQTAALALVLPRRGQTGDPLPMLEVHYQEHQGTRALAVIGLDMHDFNVWQRRQDVMRQMGETWARQGWQVLALRFITCAWIRAMSEADMQARQGRLIESYDDKQEVMLVQGSTLDGRQAVATAEILRNKAGRVRATRPWDIRHDAGDGAWRLEMGTLNCAWEAYVAAVVRVLEARDTPHC